MRYFSFWGTQTGRLNTQKPHSYMDIRDARPKGTPIINFFRVERGAKTPVSITHDEIVVDPAKDGGHQALESIRKVFFNNYSELEKRMENMQRYLRVDNGHKNCFDFNVLKYEIPKTWQPAKPQGTYVVAKPIDLIPLETFRVEMTIPQSAHTDLHAITIGKLQELLMPKCSCEMKTLLREGCQCGGV